MNAGPAKNARKPTLGPQEAALRDALVVASLIFLSFLGSALLVLDGLRQAGAVAGLLHGGDQQVVV